MAITPPEADLSQDPDFDGDVAPPARAAAPADDEHDDPEAVGEVLEDGTPPRGPDGKFQKASKKAAAKKPGEDDEPPQPTVEETPEEQERKAKEAEHAKRYELLEEAKKEQLRARKTARDLEAREAKLAAEREQVQAYFTQRERDISAREARVAKIEAVLANPTFEGLQELGLDYQQWTRQALDANTPEGLARNALAEAKRLRDELAKRDRETQERAAQAQAHQANQRDASTLVTIVDQHADDYPHLATFPEETVARMGIARRDQILARGGRPTYRSVLAELEAEARDFEEIRQARLTKRQSGQKSDGGPTANGTATTNGTSPQASTRTTGKPTLTNQTAATRATPPREMTEEEKDEWALTQLRSLSTTRRART